MRDIMITCEGMDSDYIVLGETVKLQSVFGNLIIDGKQSRATAFHGTIIDIYILIEDCFALSDYGQKK